MTGTFSPDDSRGRLSGPSPSSGRGASREFPFDPVTSSRSAFTEMDAESDPTATDASPVDARRSDATVPAPRGRGTAAAGTTPATAAAHLDAFATHLRYERALSPHTVRAYLGDVTTLLGHLRDPEGTRPESTDPDAVLDLAGLDLAVLRSWLATGLARG